MKIGFDQWHDGTGYDLEALAGMTPEDRAAAEAVLVAHLAGPGDWRDVEALATLATPGAMAALKVAAKHGSPEVRNRALEVLAQAEPQPGALDLAQSHPTPRVKRAVLDCARLADPTTRVHAAALLMYLCGKADEPFDWNQRPFFLRFASEDNRELRAAWTELRARTGM